VRPTQTAATWPLTRSASRCTRKGLSDEFGRLARLAGLPAIRLHATRASMNTILEKAGVPETLRASWMGHTIAVNRNNYLGAPRPEELTVISDKIGPIFRAV
jgi:integrase